MVARFSNSEMEKLHTSWLAWKDVNSEEFLENFKKIWENSINEVESLLKKCNYRCNLRDVHRVGLTLQPNISFNFSPIIKGYFLNVWTFFFCVDRVEKSLYFRPTFLLANELVHEHAHYMFWSNYGLHNEDRDELQKLHDEHALDGEKYALSEEAKLLKKLRFVTSRLVDVKLFRVRSWESNGIPDYCEIRATQIMAQKQVKESLKSVQKKKKELQNLSSIEFYNKEMDIRKTQNKSIISSILNLKQKKEFPIVEMEIT